jgi:hypothetical protein
MYQSGSLCFLTLREHRLKVRGRECQGTYFFTKKWENNIMKSFIICISDVLRVIACRYMGLAGYAECTGI